MATARRASKPKPGAVVCRVLAAATPPTPRRRRRAYHRDDTLLSNAMLLHATAAILERVRLDRTWDIPYLAGYSVDGRTVYIDRHLPRTYRSHGRRVRVDPFLILHESVEKALVDRLGLRYQHAHQIALRAERASVLAAGLSWRRYNRFMIAHIKGAGHERLTRVPPPLHLKPYWDERDIGLIRRMQETIAAELAAAGGKTRR